MIYFYFLEIALSDKHDSHIYAFENLSHIPASKLIEIFGINLTTDPNIIQGYPLTKQLYLAHKEYIDENLVPINLKVFEYTLRLYSGEESTSVRRLYKVTPLE